MTRRRKLLLCGVPAVIGLAVVAGLMVLVALTPSSEASRKANEIQLGMTIEQVQIVLAVKWEHAAQFEECFWKFDDDSVLTLTFKGNRLTEWKVGWNNPWDEKIRQFLRKAGLPI